MTSSACTLRVGGWLPERRARICPAYGRNRGLSMSVAQLLRSAAAARPDAPAIDGDGRRLSFGELDAVSNRVANALIAAGVGPGDRVGFVDRNSTEYWETFLGALKAGAVLVPMNFRLSPAEASWLLDDAGAKVVVAGAPFTSLVEP